MPQASPLVLEELRRRPAGGKCLVAKADLAESLCAPIGMRQADRPRLIVSRLHTRPAGQHAALAAMEQKVTLIGGDQNFGGPIERIAFADAA